MDEHAKRVPYEMRHTYASLVSASGITAEEVAQHLGHNRTSTFELVYRPVLKPRRRAGQHITDTIVGRAGRDALRISLS
jgi:integrase